MYDVITIQSWFSGSRYALWDNALFLLVVFSDFRLKCNSVAILLNHIPDEMMEEYEGPLFGDDVRQEVLQDDDVRQEGGGEVEEDCALDGNVSLLKFQPNKREKSMCFTTVNETELVKDYNEAVEKVKTTFLEYQREGSGWQLDKVLHLDLGVAAYKPVEGASYLPLPKKIKNKKAVLNVQNDDLKCFLWSVLAAKHPIHSNPHRVNQYKPYESELNMAGIDYPVKIDQVKKFERQNPTISVSVFGFEEQELFPLQDLLDDHEPHCSRHGPQKIKLPDEDHTTLQYTEALPVNNFGWLTEQEATELQQDLMTLPDDGTEGYILEVDLSYPEELHDLHNDYPLAPERQKVTQDMLSPYCQQLNEELNLGGAPVAKLVPNLNDKQHYILHYRNLKQYLTMGMKLTKVHRVLGFDQIPWLKKYIDFNTEKRKHATNDFEKDFFKLMNNSVFGKTMENLRKRVSVKLLNTPKQLKKLTANPLFDYFRIFDENLVGVNMKKPSLYLNRPIYVGFCILDLSKTLMYDFHYNVIKQKYGNNATLLFTDTDSLCYNIKTEDIYEDMYEDLDLYDTSEYPRDHVLHSTVNKKVLGKMKDETHGLPIEEFVGLRPKMYSLLYHEEGREVEKKTAKEWASNIGNELYQFSKNVTHVEDLQKSYEALNLSTTVVDWRQLLQMTKENIERYFENKIKALK
ncbi:hypothetical protein QZH41_001793, partial [Actinostola sp. cb2023]